MENNLVAGKCNSCNGTGNDKQPNWQCYNCSGTGEQCYDGTLDCSCCGEVIGYIGWDCDMNGNMFVCISCRNKGAIIVRTPNDRGGTDLSFKLPE